MSKVICIAGESGSGKTTSMRNLDPKTTYYIDADCKENSLGRNFCGCLMVLVQIPKLSR